MTKPAIAEPSTSSSATGNRAAIATAIAVSVAVIAFLSWLIYAHHVAPGQAAGLTFLAPLEAVFNGASAVAIVLGVRFIKRRRIVAHRNSMISAFVFSVLFFIVYTVHHALQGDMIFAGHGAIRVTYLAILISHIVLSAVALPLILITFFFALTRRFSLHRKIAPITYPIWLYVSVTGVVVYVMLAAWR